MYLETMSQVLAPMNKIILDDSTGRNIVPYLPLPDLTKNRTESVTVTPSPQSGASAQRPHRNSPQARNNEPARSRSWRLAVVLPAGIAVVVVLYDQPDGQVIVLQFGAPRAVETEPGLHVKIPGVQTVEYIDKRLLNVELPSEEVIAQDKKRIVIDAFARWRIADPIASIQSVTTRTSHSAIDDDPEFQCPRRSGCAKLFRQCSRKSARR